jgi:hypothetical protein
MEGQLIQYFQVQLLPVSFYKESNLNKIFTFKFNCPDFNSSSPIHNIIGIPF